jgi:hypothetical protein
LKSIPQAQCGFSKELLYCAARPADPDEIDPWPTETLLPDEDDTRTTTSMLSTPEPTSAPVTSTKPNGPSSTSYIVTPAEPNAPSPTQASSIISSCNKFVKVTPGDGCWSIANANKIRQEDFYAWNKVLGKDGSQCNTMLWLGYYYCVGISS